MLNEVIGRFPNEEAFKEFLFTIKWMDKVTCPFCNSTRNTPVKKRFRYHCNVCNTNHSLTVNTIMHNTKIDLRKWLICLYIVLKDKKISYRNLGKIIEVDKKTAYKIIGKLEIFFRDNQLEILRLSGLEKDEIEVLTMILLINVKKRRDYFGRVI